MDMRPGQEHQCNMGLLDTLNYNLQQQQQHQQQQPPGELQPGQWVVIQAIKRGPDPILKGQQGQVVVVEAGGWVSVSVPNLSRVVKVQQCFLLPLPPLLPPTQQLPHQGFVQWHTLDPLSPSGADVTSPRLLKRHHYEGYVRPLHLGQSLPPLQVPPQAEGSITAEAGRDVSKGREPVMQLWRGLRRDLLSLEAVVPWEMVDASWKVRRPFWHKQMAQMVPYSQEGFDAALAAMAAAMRELHDALQMDKCEAPGPRAVLARGGDWDARLTEMAAGGGNNVQCLLHLFDEFNEAVRSWLQGQGFALPPFALTPSPRQLPVFSGLLPLPTLGVWGNGSGVDSARGALGAAGYARSAAGTAGAVTGLGGGQGGGATAPRVAPSLRVLDATGVLSVQRALRALSAGQTNSTLGQVSWDRLLGVSRATLQGLMAYVGREEGGVLHFLQALFRGADVPGLVGLPQSEVDRLPDADLAVLLLLCPPVRARLRLGRVPGQPSWRPFSHAQEQHKDPDSECTDDEGGAGGEATDMEP